MHKIYNSLLAQVLVIVKNITIKDEAYKYLKRKKGKKSFSDIILQDSQVNYNQKTIELNAQAIEALNQIKGLRSYSQVILDLTKRTQPANKFLHKFYGTLSKKEGNDFNNRIQYNRKKMESELNDRS
ncbi:MAG: antitoxin VapB family protein [Candidatus Woesearchaeota archaeon]